MTSRINERVEIIERALVVMRGRADREAEKLAAFDARLTALESPCVEPPQAAGWPAPDCAAVAGEALPVVTCGWCGDDAVQVRIIFEADGAHLYSVAPACGVHGLSENRHDLVFITGEPARVILRAIAREAARVRQGGAG